jgi:hypothetical protein
MMNFGLWVGLILKDNKYALQLFTDLRGDLPNGMGVSPVLTLISVSSGLGDRPRLGGGWVRPAPDKLRHPAPLGKRMSSSCSNVQALNT